MNTITDRQRKWLDTLYKECMNEVEDSVASTSVFGDDYLCPECDRLTDKTKVHVLDMDIINAAYYASKLGRGFGILNFGSYTNPGTGSVDERMLCEQSTLYPALESQTDRYYANHKDTAICGDDVIHSSNITLFSTPDVESNPIVAEVFTASLCDLTKTNDTVIAMAHMTRRMRKLYKLFNYTGCGTIVISANSCTEFGYNDLTVAQMWLMTMYDNPGLLKNVVFSSMANPGSYKELFREYIL